MKLALILLVLNIFLVQGRWDEPQNVSNSKFGAHNSSLATDAFGNSHITWCECTDKTYTEPWTLMYSNNSNGPFGSPVYIGSGDCRKSQVIVSLDDANHIYVVFQAYRVQSQAPCRKGNVGGCSDVWFVESTDGGMTWSTPITLPHHNDAQNRYTPVMRVIDGTVVVIYDYNNQYIGFTIRALGSSFTTEVLLPFSANVEQFPNIEYTIDNENIYYHVFFNQGPANFVELYYSKFDGDNWTNPVALSSSKGGGTKQMNVISDTIDTLFVVYADSDEGPLMYTWSSDNGDTWTPPNGIYPNTTNFPSQTLLDNDTIAIAYNQGLDCPCSVGFGLIVNGNFKELNGPEAHGMRCSSWPRVSNISGNVTIAFSARSEDIFDIYFNWWYHF